MTDSDTIKSSCSRSPSPIVRFLLLWMPDILDHVVPPALLNSAGLFSTCLADKSVKQTEDSRSNLSKLASANKAELYLEPT